MTDSFTHGYALLIGVGVTAEPQYALPGTAQDARALYEILADPGLCAYPDDNRHIRLLVDEHATRDAVREGLLWLKNCSEADLEATILVYFSGHGWIHDAGEQYYMILNDTQSSDIDETALAATELTIWIRKIRARRLLVILDCCHAEGMARSKSIKVPMPPQGFRPQPMPKGIVDRLAEGQGRAVFSSSRDVQYSWTHPRFPLSIFTYHLLEALQGAGNMPGEREVRLSNVMSYLSKAVPATARTLHREQTPFFKIEAEDFAVATQPRNDYPVGSLQGGKGLPSGGWQEMQGEAALTIRQVLYATGYRNVVIGGNAKGNIIVAGDSNVLQTGKYNLKADNIHGLAIGDHAHVDVDSQNDEADEHKRRVVLDHPKRSEHDGSPAQNGNPS